jgi:hypothetical protein
MKMSEIRKPTTYICDLCDYSVESMNRPETWCEMSLVKESRVRSDSSPLGSNYWSTFDVCDKCHSPAATSIVASKTQAKTMFKKLFNMVFRIKEQE